MCRGMALSRLKGSTMIHLLRRLSLMAVLMAMPVGYANADNTLGMQYGAELLTAFPVQLSVGGHAETPQRIRLHSSLGFFPSPYLKTINAAAESYDLYDESTSALIEAALENSIVLRLGLAWRPWSEAGFYFGGAYMLAFLGGGLSGEETLSAVTGQSTEGSRREGREFDVNANVHFIDIEVGWRWLFGENIYLRTALGGAFTVASSTEVNPNWSPSALAQPSVNALSRAGEAYLDDIFTRYVHTASVNVAVGWLFK